MRKISKEMLKVLHICNTEPNTIKRIASQCKWNIPKTRKILKELEKKELVYYDRNFFLKKEGLWSTTVKGMRLLRNKGQDL